METNKTTDDENIENIESFVGRRPIYIKSSNFIENLSKDATYIRDKKGYMMAIDNFVFYWKRALNNHITWTCRQKNCLSRCNVCRVDDTVKECSPHTCVAHTNFEMYHLGFVNKVEEKSASENTRFSTIYTQERNTLINESGAGPEEIAKT